MARNLKTLKQRLFLAVSCLLLAHGFVCKAAMIYYVNGEGHVTGFVRSDINDPSAALAALASPPAGQALTSGVPSGTQVRSLQTESDTVIVDFSTELIGAGLDEARMGTIFGQVRATLDQFGFPESVRLLAEGKRLSSYLPPPPVFKHPLQAPIAAAANGLAGKKISLSPGHGLNWSGSSWVTQRPVYCAPLNQEDYHNLEISKYLDTYLSQDGATVKKYRCFDKNYGTHAPSGHAFWHMAGCYWTKEAGYPCSVYASSSGDCNLASGGSELNDAVRAGPVAANYDNTDVHVSVHSNGNAGDCTGTGCANGTITYYDSDPSHAAWTIVSSNLAKKVQSAYISAVRTKYPDATWRDRGIGDANGSFAETRIPNRAAILIETAFHDSCDRDALYLRDNFFRSTIMWATYKGICDYFGTTPTWDYYSYEVVSHNLPAQVAPGSTNTVQITLRNRGVLWNDTQQFRLGAVNDSDPFSPVTRYNVGSEVGPDVTKTFTVTLIAPLTPGIYTTDWRMLREAVTWFGPTVSQNIIVGNLVDTNAPSKPTNLVATVVSYNQIDLRWNASTDDIGVTSYQIYRDAVLLGTTSGTNFSDTTCASMTTYSYQVTALDGAGNQSPLSNVLQATTPAKRDFIIDNPDGTLTGSWVTGVSSTDKYGDDYRYKSTGASDTATFTWRPTIEEAGLYDVFVWYPDGSNRSAEAPFTVAYAGNSVVVAVNQQTGGGVWKKIASSRPFLPGTSGYVRLANGTGEASTQNVMADAVRFTYVAAIPAPVVGASPQSQSVCPGSTVNFSLTMNGAGPFSYQWRKTSVALAGATASSLALVGVTNGNAGNYDVVVTNVSGATTSGVAVLTVKIPPGITTPPTNQTVNLGANVGFTLLATGTAPLSYQWRKGGVPIVNATGTAFNLSNVTVGDAGEYNVSVTNDCGAVTSALASLTVNLPVPPVLWNTFTGGVLTLTWTNAHYVLQEATNLTGATNDWADILGATSPYIPDLTAASKFFRLRN